MTSQLCIRGFGFHAPTDCLTNGDLEKFVDTSDEWISTRTGIRQRHKLQETESGSDVAAAAARQALDHAGVNPGEISHVITATCTPDYLCPSTACLISAKLDMHGPMAFDINAACSGFVYGLDLARGILRVQPKAKILLIGSEALTRRLNWQDRGTCVVFGDGAGAVVLEASEAVPQGGARVEDVICHADGAQAGLLTLGGGTRKRYELGEAVGDDFFVSMKGQEIYKHAVRTLTKSSRDIVERNGYRLDDVDLFIPHQANLRIIEAVGERLGLKGERVFVNIADHGNTSAASIPLALGEASAAGRLRPGMLVLLATFGGGFTWGSALLRF